MDKNQIKNQAAQKYSAISGVGTLNKNQFVGGAYSRSSGMPAGAGGVTIDPEEELLIATIQNTETSTTLVAPLFSVNEGLVVPFNGTSDIKGVASTTGKGIVISWNGRTENEIKEMIRTGAITLVEPRYAFGTSAQLNLNWFSRHKEGASLKVEDYYPSVKRELSNNVATELDFKGFFLAVEKATTLCIPVAGSTTIQVAFKVHTKVDPSRLLIGQSALVQKGY